MKEETTMSEDLKKSPEEWVEHYQSHYIATLTAEIASRIIKNDMTNVARSCISIGFHLKAVRDRELFREMGYDSLWNYAADQFGLSMSSASRYIAINDQFSVGGNTPQLQPEYRNFSKSQLQEMLNMSPEQIGQVLSALREFSSVFGRNGEHLKRSNMQARRSVRSVGADGRKEKAFWRRWKKRKSRYPYIVFR